jgi:hypothetical protein
MREMGFGGEKEREGGGAYREGWAMWVEVEGWGFSLQYFLGEKSPRPPFFYDFLGGWTDGIITMLERH